MPFINLFFYYASFTVEKKILQLCRCHGNYNVVCLFLYFYNSSAVFEVLFIYIIHLQFQQISTNILIVLMYHVGADVDKSEFPAFG